jgi:hypothetical protein
VLGTPTTTNPLTQRYPPLFMEPQEPQHQTRQKVLHLVGTEPWSSSPLPVYTKLLKQGSICQTQINLFINYY